MQKENLNEFSQCMHSDICDLRNTMSRGGKYYFITFIDDFSRFTYVYLLKSKDEALSKFKIYVTEVENKLNRTVVKFRSDRGGEYTLKEFTDFCESEGIKKTTTAPYTPQQNGIAGKKKKGP